jgi:hypothetical protein
MTKLVGQVRAVERAMGNSNMDAQKGIVEKRSFKLDVRPANKADTYYGYGSMQFILHGRELEDSGLDLGTKVAVYLVPEGEQPPAEHVVQDLQAEVYQLTEKVQTVTNQYESEKRRTKEYERTRWDASEKLKGLQAENVRLTTELLTLRGAVGNYADSSPLLEGNGPTTRPEAPEVVS